MRPLFRSKVPEEFSLQRIVNRIRDKANAEIDLYMDGLSRHEKPKAVPEATVSRVLFVSIERLDQLRSIKTNKWDLQRLIKMCEEINVCATGDCPHALIMLTRAILDHVPPVFGVNSFGQVANNYAGSRSFKEVMARLDESSRKIADLYLHVQIRNKESVASMAQANFSPEIDLLLSEIIRNLK